MRDGRSILSLKIENPAEKIDLDARKINAFKPKKFSFRILKILGRN